MGFEKELADAIIKAVETGEKVRLNVPVNVLSISIIVSNDKIKVSAWYGERGPWSSVEIRDIANEIDAITIYGVSLTGTAFGLTFDKAENMIRFSMDKIRAIEVKYNERIRELDISGFGPLPKT